MAEPALQVGLIGEPGGWHLEDLARAGRARGHRVATIPWTCLASRIGETGERLGPAAASACSTFVIRGMPRGGLEEVVFRMNAVARLEAAGQLVINRPRSLEIAIDKYLTTARLADAGLPVPRTAVAQDVETIRENWAALGGDVVAKPLFGSCGRGLERLRSLDDLTAFLDRRPAGSPVYLQEFVPHPHGDLRILLVGERAFTIRRQNRSDDWRTNVSLGGSAERAKATPAMLDLAHRAATATDTEIAGVDLLPAADGRLLVLEVNAVPGWKAVSSVLSTDIATEVIAYLEQKTDRTLGKRDSQALPRI